MLAHLLKYDTAQGGYCGKIGEGLHTVEADDEAGTITVDGKTLKIYAMAKAAELPWGEIGVDVVLECTGFYCSKDKAQAHIDAGAKKVVISAPAGNDLPTVVFGVNESILTADFPFFQIFLQQLPPPQGHKRCISTREQLCPLGSFPRLPEQVRLPWQE